MKRIKKAVLFVLGILVLSSCSSNDSKNENYLNIEEDLFIEDIPEPKLTLVYARSPDESKATLRIIEEYNAQSDKYTVVYQELPSDEQLQYQQLKAGLAGPEPEYDVVDLNVVWNAEFAQSGLLLPIGQYMMDDNVSLDDYYKGITDAVWYLGQVWSLPKTVSTGLLYYRTDIVDDPPETFEELIEMARRLKWDSGLSNGYIFCGKVSEPLVTEAIEMILANGGKITDETGQLDLNNAGAIAGLEMLNELYNADFVPDNLYKITERDALVNFMEGNSVFMRNTPSAWNRLNNENSMVQNKFSIAALPGNNGYEAATLNGVVAGISLNTKNPDAAWDFISYLTGYEGSKITAIESGRIPAYKIVLEDGDVIAKNPYFASDIFKNALNKAIHKPIASDYAFLSSTVQDELYRYLNGKQSAEDMVLSIDRKIKAGW